MNCRVVQSSQKMYILLKLTSLRPNHLHEDEVILGKQSNYWLYSFSSHCQIVNHSYLRESNQSPIKSGGRSQICLFLANLTPWKDLERTSKTLANQTSVPISVVIGFGCGLGVGRQKMPKKGFLAHFWSFTPCFASENDLDFSSPQLHDHMCQVSSWQVWYCSKQCVWRRCSRSRIN